VLDVGELQLKLQPWAGESLSGGPTAGFGPLADCYLLEIMATVGLNPRFEVRSASLAMLILENSGIL
jgi:hypothetical protein